MLTHVKNQHVVVTPTNDREEKVERRYICENFVNTSQGYVHMG